MSKHLILLFLLAAVSCSNGKTGKNNNSPIVGSEFLLIQSIAAGQPGMDKCDQILEYSGFHLCYNEEHEQASWVAYILTKEMIQNSHVPRSNNYRADPNIKTGSAELSDYSRSGYTRGHLAPAGAMKWSKEAMSETFFLSNMSPQLYDFNGGIWEKLERKVRHWAHQEGAVYVVTGPVLTSGLHNIGYTQVSIPQYYYKVILDIQPPDYKGIAFIMDQTKSTGDPMLYSLSIDSAEEFSGIDFFPSLPDSIEIALESHFDTGVWE